MSSLIDPVCFITAGSRENEMIDFGTEKLESESVRAALDHAWRDHHCRDQTWKALQMELVLIAAVIAISYQTENVPIMLISSALSIILSICGIQITKRHRNNVECLKFEHIRNCGEALGIMRQDLINGTGVPSPINIMDAFNPKKANTALFILRMHVGIGIFSLVYFVWILCSKVWP